MKTDLEQSVDKISFLKEYYPGIESPGYIEALPKQELLCCLCLLDSILFSIEQNTIHVPLQNWSAYIDAEKE